MKFSYLFLIFLLFACSEMPKSDEEIDGLDQDEKEVIIETDEVDSLPPATENGTQTVSKKSKYRFESFETPNVGWGYSIYEGTKEFIRQPHIPAIQGTQGFATKDQADRVAKEVVRKLDNGIMPPTLSVDEMQKLGAI